MSLHLYYINLAHVTRSEPNRVAPIAPRNSRRGDLDPSQRSRQSRTRKRVNNTMR